MKKRVLGNSGIEVTPLCFGGWALAGGFTWGEQDERDSIEALQAAYDSGIRFFDTAEAYGMGYSEELIGKVLRNVRDKIVIATKVSKENFEPDKMRKACEASLNRLQTDYIDLYQLHWPDPYAPMDKIFQTLEKLKEEGKIRAIGVSNFGVQGLKRCKELKANVVSNQLAYSLLFRAIEYEIQPICVEYNISILPYGALLQGLLTGKFKTPDDVPVTRARTRHFSRKRIHVIHDEEGAEEETWDAIGKIKKLCDEAGLNMASIALAWLLTKPAVTSVIVGGRNRKQVEESAQAMSLSLSQDVVDELDRITEPLKQKLGSNADMWQSKSRVW